MEDRATPISRLQPAAPAQEETGGNLVNDILREMDQAEESPQNVTFNEEANQVHEEFETEPEEAEETEEMGHMSEEEMNAYMEHEQSAVRVFMTKEAVVLFILFVALQMPQIQIHLQQILQKLFSKLSSTYISYIDMVVRAIALIIAFMLIREFFL
jgi:flagellar biosynthesis GTPase FlhF